MTCLGRIILLSPHFIIMIASLRNKPTVRNSILFICDIQERFRSIIHNMPTVIAHAGMLVDVCQKLEVPRLVTEQNRKAFMPTVSELNVAEGEAFDKKVFSMMIPSVTEKLRSYPDVKHVILCGIEAHVCVQQTALDLLHMGYTVHLVADAISSQRPYDRTVALQKMTQAGGVVTTASSMVFELLETAEHKDFKTISNIVKAARADEYKERESL